MITVQERLLFKNYKRSLKSRYAVHRSNVTAAYYDQEHQVLHMDKTLLDELSGTYPDMTNTQVKKYLAVFLPEDVQK